jgi:WD40 repeat protein
MKDASATPPETLCEVCGTVSVAGFCGRCAFSKALLGMNSNFSPETADGLPPSSAPEGFELLHELGRGGSASVWLARERKLDRFVAVKLIALHSDSRLSQRLVREGQAVAQLKHPHIVAVYALGTTGHHAYLAMEFLEGGDLRQKLKRGVLAPQQAAALAVSLASALGHSHEHHILHRDIKPSNILLSAAGEPKLADFGLAAPLEGAGDLTLPGQVAGTAAYLAPELLEGARHASERSDLYSLGAVLYECLVGRAPFVGDSSSAIFAQIAASEPPAPRLLHPEIPRDLETICLKCLQKHPPSRYATAADLRADLERFLRGEPISARPLSRIGLMWRWVRRNRSLAGLGAALALATLLGVGGILWQWRRAEQAVVTTALNLYSADLKVASDALLASNLGLAERTLDSCPPEFRDAAWGLLSPFTRGDVETVIGSANGTITHVALSPSGEFAATTAQADNVRIWNLVTNQPAGELPDTKYGWWAEFSRDGRELFTADRTVKQWDFARRTVIHEFPGRSGALSPAGDILYTCEGQRFVFDGTADSVTAWRVSDASLLFKLPVQARIIAASPNGKLLAATDAENFIALFDARDGRPVSERWPSLGKAWALTFSPDSSLLVASGWSTEVRVWKLAGPTTSPTVQRLTHPSGTWGAVFSPDGATLAVACSDSSAHLWDVATWRETRRALGHTNEVWSLAWEQNAKLLSGGRDLRLLRLRTVAPPMPPPPRHDRRPYDIVWLNGGYLATVREIGGVNVTEIASVQSDSAPVRFAREIPLAFDDRQQRLWLWSEEGELRGRSAANLKDINRVPFALLPGEELAAHPGVAPQAGLAWAALKDGALIVQRLEDGKRVARYEKVFVHSSPAAALSPDGSRFVWGGLSTELSMLDRKTGQRLSLSGHRYEVSAIMFAPDGMTMISGGADGLIIVWDARTGERLHQLGQHATSVGALALSPDGRVVFSQEPGVGIYMWHPATLREIGRLPVNGSFEAEWLGVSPDARWLGIRLGDGTIRIVPLDVSAEKVGSEQ